MPSATWAADFMAAPIILSRFSVFHWAAAILLDILQESMSRKYDEAAQDCANRLPRDAAHMREQNAYRVELRKECVA